MFRLPTRDRLRRVYRRLRAVRAQIPVGAAVAPPALPVVSGAGDDDAAVAFARAKARKLERIAPLLRTGTAHVRTAGYFDCLTDDLRRRFGAEDGGPVSSNGYDADGLALFARHAAGLVLDVGAGFRSTYYENVVNFEIAPYASTDVRGVAEDLPFADASFDAVICIAVLEHVRDPFRSAAEIVRVLKPGGDLICCVPFLQPLHGYPHHYYNMTHEGLRRLFDRDLVVDRIEVPHSTLPIWSLTWILRSWGDGLAGADREQFMDLRVRDLIGDPLTYLNEPWVRGLTVDKNLELASACVLFARKPPAGQAAACVPAGPGSTLGA